MQNKTFFQKIVDVKPNEFKALAWSWLYVFALFLAYYTLRPIRDELGVAGGMKNLPWLFSGTLIAMLALTPFLTKSATDAALAILLVKKNG